MLLDNGISKIKIEKTNGLKIYSKYGAKLTHGGFSIGSSSDIEFENIKMDEMWQWEDSDTFSPNFNVGDYDVYGWAYFKISNSNNIYIHDCSFGKSYDGQIDISDSNYWHHKELAELRAPYGTAREANYTISRCNFDAGSKDESGYIYKMMQDIENDYVSNGKESKYKYYYTLRNDYNLSFEDILNAIALPQKKGLLLGDRSKYGEAINYYAHINFDSCKFTNIEDRLPKVRSGFVYMSNCIFDNSLYMKTHLNLTKDEKNSVKNINLKYKKFKCALTSQGLVISQNGDVIAENCIFIGIKELVKNNEGDGSLGGFMLVNCKYDQKADGSIVKLDTSLNYDSFKVNSVSNIEFNYHNENNIQEIQPEIIDLKL
jgi:pectate lyase